ncbi:hypothetical protein [Sulfidibacter corallicola]|uniref:Photosynthesis system II assembly factor Ycf48/Hcf136-like domain-containing protein n=1 Tax=Sulfidibacter corallicola TaxID=2818388 RepID=A0A8A4TKT4_SULCO|nr:hypothetical protein [Sulfidibacter corallicola]QTD50087.1 hypothetical protein J3U87_31265 [Sulfidibacter corallicola]
MPHRSKSRTGASTRRTPSATLAVAIMLCTLPLFAIEWTPVGNPSAMVGATRWLGSLITVGNDDSHGWISSSFDTRNWELEAAGPLQTFSSLAVGNGRMLATTDHGTVWSSTNGNEWSQYATGFSSLRNLLWARGQWWALASDRLIASENGQTWDEVPLNLGFGEPDFLLDTGPALVIVTDFKEVYTSEDGSDWTRQGISGDVDLNMILQFRWVNDRIVGIGGQGGIVTSEDGITWTRHTTPTNAILHDAAGNDTLKVVVGDQGTVLYSEDDATWNEVELPGAPDLVALSWTGVEFVAATGAGELWVSGNGSTWSARGINPSAQFLDIAEGDDTLLVLARDMSGDQHLLRSEDGVEWTRHGSPLTNQAQALTWTGRGFALLGTRELAVSEDGSDWTRGAFGSGAMQAVAQNEETYLAIDTQTLWRSTNAVSWTRVSSEDALIDDARVVWDGERFVLVSRLGTATSSDGAQWATQTRTESFTPMELLYSGSRFLAIGKNGKISTSTNGTDWTTRRYLGGNREFQSMVWTGSTFLASSDDGHFHATTAADHWTSWPMDLNDTTSAFASHENQVIAAGADHLWRTTQTFNPNQAAFEAQVVVPWVVDNDQWTSRIALTNLEPNGSLVRFRATTGLGEVAELERWLEPDQVRDWQAEELFPGMTGYALSVSTSETRIFGSFLTFNTEEASGGMSPSQTTASSIEPLTDSLVFGYLPADQIAAVVLVAHEPLSTQTSVTLSLFGEGQQVIAERELLLQGERPRAELLTGLFANVEIPVNASLIAVSANGSHIAGTTFVFNQRRQPSMARALSVDPDTLP